MMDILSDIKVKRSVVLFDDYGDVIDDKMFDTVEEAKEYFMNNVDVEIQVTVELDTNDVEKYYTIPEEEEEEWEDWEDKVYELLRPLLYNYKGSSMNGCEYTLEGTPNDLIHFMENYSSHYNFDDIGEYFYEEKKEFLKWIDSLFPTGFFSD